jgi:hypothetical protein
MKSGHEQAGAIILAGGEGTRLLSLTRRLLASPCLSSSARFGKGNVARADAPACVTLLFARADRNCNIARP